MSSKQVTSACPSCQCIARQVHSHYERKLADLPWEGIAVRICLQVRKFFCRNVECQQRIFCERLPKVVDPYAHRTKRGSGRNFVKSYGNDNSTSLC
ncbi:MAG: transposase family protein [Blastocatellales bacterium]